MDRGTAQRILKRVGKVVLDVVGPVLTAFPAIGGPVKLVNLARKVDKIVDALKGAGQALKNSFNNALQAGKKALGSWVKNTPNVRPDVVLSGGRSGQKVKNLLGPPNSAVRGGGDRIFITNEKGQVILDITKGRVKTVIPGKGFGPTKRKPTSEERDLLQDVLGGGQ